MKGYEIAFKCNVLPDYTHTQVIAAESVDEAREKFIKHTMYEGVEILYVKFVYSDIKKEFYDVGDAYGWD